MRYRNAGCGRRFLAYLIDFFLIGIVSAFILSLIPYFSNKVNEFVVAFNAYIESAEAGNLDEALYNTVLSYSTRIAGITFLGMLPVVFLYLVVLPYFWKYQTLGRLLMRIKVVNLMDEENPSFAKLVLREIVGFLVYNFLSSTFIFLILIWYFSIRGRSLADLIGGTRLVDAAAIQTEEEHRDYMDAHFKEVDSTPKEEENTETDYKVF